MVATVIKNHEKFHAKAQLRRLHKPQPKTRGGNIEAQLQNEFNRLKDMLGVGHELELVWSPKAVKGLSSEVKNGKLYIYEESLDEASQALRHELVDYLITSRIVEPLVGLINALIKSREVEIYRTKEVIVERLAKLLG